MKNRLPQWFRQEVPDTTTQEMARMLSEFNLHTVCQEARCPNQSHCFKKKRLAFMILGGLCTRKCRFCAIKRAEKPSLPFDEDEASRISQIAEKLSLRYVVITSVTRDDLADGGAAIFARVIKLIHGLNRDIKVEALIPDFSGRSSSLEAVVGACPSVIGHNLETVARLYKELKPDADYSLSLKILRRIKEINPSLNTKSSLLLGLGEKEEEVIESAKELRDVNCDILTLGQYLSPTQKHYPVKEFIGLEKFREYREIGLKMGFKSVLSGPKVRSSYQAEEVYEAITY